MSMTIVFLGIHIAKNVFSLHGVDATGTPERAARSIAGVANE
jgi:hypothetical protein